MEPKEIKSNEDIQSPGSDEVFVIGLGPSLRNFDFERLRDKDTITANYALRDVPKVTYAVMADSGVIRKAVNNNFWDSKDTIKIVVMGPEHRRYHKVEDCLNRYDRIIHPFRFDGKIGFNYDHFATGKCTGFCAFQLAVLLGYKKINLLGIDLTAENGKRHYYDKNEVPDPGRCLKSFYRNFKEAIDILHSKTEIEIISRSTISKLNSFIPYASLGEIT